MLDFFSETKALGISLSERFGKAAVVTIKNGTPVITHLGKVDLTDPNVKRLDIPDGSIDEDTIIVSGLASDDLLIRSLSVKLTKRKDIESVLPFEAEPLLPFSSEDGVLDFMEISRTNGQTNIAVLAVKKETLEAHLSHLMEYHIDPEYTSSSPVALAVFSNAIDDTPTEEPVLIMHIGDKQTYCVLAVKDTPLGVHIIHKGVSHLKQALEKDVGPSTSLESVDFSNIPSKFQELTATFTSLKQEVSRAVLSLAKQHKAQSVSKVLLTGKGAILQGIVSSLSSELKVEISEPAPKWGETKERLQVYAIPIGLALDALLHEEPKVNFRKQEFGYKDPWKRLKKPILFFAGFCLLLSVGLYMFGSALIGKRLDSAKQEYANLLKETEKPYSQFEQEYLSKNPYSATVQLKDMNAEELMSRLLFLQNEIQQSPDPYKLLPDVPRVSDVLGWLANNPLIAPKGKHRPLLDIKNFQYTLVKRPNAKKRSEKYQAKIELEFSSETPKAAREFHDSLIEPNELIDPKGEVKWSSSGDVYRTSFFLKNKPPKKGSREVNDV